MRAALLASCSPARKTLSIASWMTDVLTGAVLDTPSIYSWSLSSVAGLTPKGLPVASSLMIPIFPNGDTKRKALERCFPIRS